MQQLRPEEEQVAKTAERMSQIVSQSCEWATAYLKDNQIRKFMEKVLQEKQITIRRIGESARRPLALGVFGASQCGKSYLVSELVRGNEPSLSVFLNRSGQNPCAHDYLEEINPAGGRESTAVVTRFSLRPYREIPGCSALLRLFFTVDLIKIFLNGFFFECQSDFLPTAEDLQKIRFSFKGVGRCRPGEGLLSESDVWDLQDYARRHFRNQFLKALEDINYWGILNDEIRFLPFDHQILYIEWLWGKFPAITTLFRNLQKALSGLGGQIVGIYEEALIPRENSIVDVQRLSQLASPGNRKMSVISENGSIVAIDAAFLCALTSELILKVQSTQSGALLENMDVLDFPGARARAQVFDQRHLANDHSALVEVFLRGKVAYLFDRYSDDRDVTGLVLCQEGGPQEAKSLPYMINKWVEWSQGADTKTREAKKPLLFQVFTKFDMDLTRKKGEDPRVRWESRLKTNFAEFFGRAGDWVENWDGSRAFQNCFWVRNPNVQQAVFGKDQTGKEFIRDELPLAEFKGQYLANEFVRRHFQNPEESWNMAATPGNPGIPFLVENLRKAIEPLTKVRQLESNLKNILMEVKTNLQPYHVGEDVTRARTLAEERAKKRLATLGKEMPVRYSLPQIIDRDRFSISEKTNGTIYDSVINPMIEEDNQNVTVGLIQSQTPVFSDDIFQIPGISSAPPETVKKNQAPPRKGELFARAVLNRWQEQLVNLSKNEKFQQKTGLNGEWFAEVIQEIMKGASRLQLETRIAEESEAALNSPNSMKFLRKTSARVAALLNRFILDLGLPRKEFQLPTGAPKATLAANAYPGLQIYIHWTTSMIQLFKDNVAVASADDETSNRVLSQILQMAI
ncbi:MAG: hypothetical protein HQM08_21165 [Candidatus Riflebacteria bacterium]|nr:hypothetical protein [Candidatus Riflebacteria bacterium]